MVLIPYLYGWMNVYIQTTTNLDANNILFRVVPCVFVLYTAVAKPV